MRSLFMMLVIAAGLGMTACEFEEESQASNAPIDVSSVPSSELEPPIPRVADTPEAPPIPKAFFVSVLRRGDLVVSVASKRGRIAHLRDLIALIDRAEDRTLLETDPNYLICAGSGALIRRLDLLKQLRLGMELELAWALQDKCYQETRLAVLQPCRFPKEAFGVPAEDGSAQPVEEKTQW